jgi:hypothetical protein
VGPDDPNAVNIQQVANLLGWAPGDHGDHVEPAREPREHRRDLGEHL